MTKIIEMTAEECKKAFDFIDFLKGMLIVVTFVMVMYNTFSSVALGREQLHVNTEYTLYNEEMIKTKADKEEVKELAIKLDKMNDRVNEIYFMLGGKADK